MKLLLFVTTLLTFINAYAQTSSYYYKKAEDYYARKEYQNAITQLDSALRQDPRNADCLFLKGNSHERLEQYQLAFDTFSQMIQFFPNDAIALNQRALLLYKIQEFEYAIQDFDKALSLKNTDSLKLALYVNRGAAKRGQRNFQGAYDDFMTAYSIDSLDIGTLNNLASVCDEVGKGDKTLEYLHRILKIDSTFVGAYGNMGFKYQESGDYRTAIKFFEKVLSLEPDNALAYSNMAFNRYKLGELDSALLDINKSLSLYPSNSYAYRTRALIYFSMKKNKVACIDLDEAARLGFTKMYGDEVEKLQTLHCK